MQILWLWGNWLSPIAQSNKGYIYMKGVIKIIFCQVSLILLVSVCVMACAKQKDEPSNVTLNLEPITMQLKVGDITTIEASGTATNIEWKSSNEEVATVYYGVVTAKAIGKAEITATSGVVSATMWQRSMPLVPRLSGLRSRDTLSVSRLHSHHGPAGRGTALPTILAGRAGSPHGGRLSGP